MTHDLKPQKGYHLLANCSRDELPYPGFRSQEGRAKGGRNVPRPACLSRSNGMGGELHIEEKSKNQGGKNILTT